MSNNTTVSLPYPPLGKVGQWWTQMVVFAIFNLFFFAFTFYKTRKNLWVPKEERHSWSYLYSYYMRLLAIPFVWQTTWRAFLPSQYNSRRTIIDDPVNSIIIARTFAFVGEICWGQQISWAIRTIARNIPMRGPPLTQTRVRKFIIYTSYWLLAFAVVGNICSVTALFFFGAVCCLLLWHFGCDSWSFDYGSNCFGVDINPFDDPNKEEPYDPPSIWVMRMFVRVMALFGIAATPYMVIVDIPKWHDRYAADVAAGRTYFNFVDGINDAASRRVPTQTYEEWSAEMFWMSGYFSAAVWTSIFLMYAPGRVTPEMVRNGENQHRPALSTGEPIVQASEV